MALCYDKLRKEVDDRIWYRSRGAFAFLVDAPHTFGHSQLVLKIRKSTQEERIFARASIHAAKCVGTLRTKLPSQRKEWQRLAKYTGTSGRYEKTLEAMGLALEKGESADENRQRGGNGRVPR